jgi:hypothetical protein
MLEALVQSGRIASLSHAVYCDLHTLLVASGHHQDERWAGRGTRGSGAGAPSGKALHGVVRTPNICDEQADDIYEWEELSLIDLVGRLNSFKCGHPFQKGILRGFMTTKRG